MFINENMSGYNFGSNAT